MLYFSMLAEENVILTHELFLITPPPYPPPPRPNAATGRPEEDNTVVDYSLFIPRRVLIGEVTHGNREKIYREQILPQMYTFYDYFDLYFGRFVQYNESGEVVAKVTLHDGKVTADDGLRATIRILYGPLEEYPFPTDAFDNKTLLTNYEALLRKNNKVENQLLQLRQDITKQQTELEDMQRKWERSMNSLKRHAETRHAYMESILRAWYLERTTPEDCSVCWQPMYPDDLVIPLCGHLICQSCHAQCPRNRCPTCRLSFSTERGELRENNVVDDDDDDEALLLLVP